MSDTGMVVATVRAIQGGNRRVVGYTFFYIGTAKWRFNRAHKWANKRIKECEYGEYNVEIIS